MREIFYCASLFNEFLASALRPRYRIAKKMPSKRRSRKVIAKANCLLCSGRTMSGKTRRLANNQTNCINFICSTFYRREQSNSRNPCFLVENSINFASFFQRVLSTKMSDELAPKSLVTAEREGDNSSKFLSLISYHSRFILAQRLMIFRTLRYRRPPSTLQKASS